jgi:uncharacterized protein YeaO (DUF488 family)
MPIRTKRWDDPRDPDDGHRLLVTRYRPRALKKEDETWDQWLPDLGPSKDLHAGAYGKGHVPITWETYRRMYLKEMTAQQPQIADLAQRSAAGETITLLCSSQCTRESRCHRSLLKDLIDQAAAAPGTAPTTL